MSGRGGWRCWPACPSPCTACTRSDSKTTDNRVLFHSLFGCFFYGVFVTKMILLTRKGLRGWVIPIVGGLVFFGLVYVWLTSALWFFQTNGITF